MCLWMTRKTNCRKHLIACHPVIYDKTILETNWPYHLSTESPKSRITIGELRKRTLPQFSLQSFIDYLVCFIIANDQVSNLFLFLFHVLTSS